MNRLTRLVLKRPVSTLLAVLALFVFGFSSLMGLLSGTDAGYGIDADEDRIYGLSRCGFRVGR